MDLSLLDIPVIAAAIILLISGLPKIADPRAIAATLESLWSLAPARTLGAGSWALDLSLLGRLLGAAEVGVAVWLVLGRSWTAAAALTMLTAGFAGAGVLGALTKAKISCACLGKQGRPLGYVHALQFPLWVGVAWSAARGGQTQPFDQRLILLSVCAACASYLYVARMWTAVLPVARSRRRAVERPGAAPSAGRGADAWSQPR